MLPLLFGHAGKVLPAEAEVEGQVWPNLPVILNKERRNILPVILAGIGGNARGADLAPETVSVVGASFRKSQ